MVKIFCAVFVAHDTNCWARRACRTLHSRLSRLCLNKTRTSLVRFSFSFPNFMTEGRHTGRMTVLEDTDGRVTVRAKVFYHGGIDLPSFRRLGYTIYDTNTLVLHP